MFDTVKFRLVGSKLRESFSPGWSVLIHATPLPGKGKTKRGERFTFKDHQTGIRVHGCKYYVDWVECSLPRVLFGCNGRLIKSQHELDMACSIVIQRLHEVMTEANSLEFLRVDLCWQFLLEPSKIIRMHEGCSHPSIRSNQMYVPGESIKWGIKESKMKAAMYDKDLEVNKTYGNILRVEVALFREKLRTAMNGNLTPLRVLDFATGWSVYRQALIAFDPTPTLGSMERRLTIAELIALVDLEGHSIAGQRCEGHYAQGRSNTISG